MIWWFFCIFFTYAVFNRAHCMKEYCTRQNTKCWPNATSWNSLRNKLSGSLHKLTTGDYDVCEIQGKDAFKIANISVCMQYHDCSKQFCDKSSTVWSVPAYSVEARTVSDIQESIKFANTHNIAVSIKTSGHSYAGSSMGKDTLLIWMHNFVKYGGVTNFTDTCHTYNEYAIKVGGGQPWDDVYKELRSQYHIVGGGGLTVSAAGGWLQGCGLSAMSRKYGIGVDNVLEFEVVLADGSLVKADACHNADLFWALRGGGGGTWGVVTSVHYKIRPSEPVTFLYMDIRNIGPPKPITTTVDSWIERWVSLSPHLDRRWGGYWTLNTLIMTFVGTKVEAETTFVDEIYKWKNALPADEKSEVILSVQQYDSYFDSRGGDKMTTDETGQTAFNIASRLIPRDWVVNSKDEAIQLLKWMVHNGYYTFNYILGGAVSDVSATNTSINPAMRKAIWQIETFTDNMAAKLREVVKDTGAGYNHASKKEPDWRTSFWGSNLKRLQELKKKYDPDNRFNCWHCVGYQGNEGPSADDTKSYATLMKPSVFLLLVSTFLFILQ